MTTIQLHGTDFAAPRLHVAPRLHPTPRLRMTARGRRVLLAVVVIPLLVIIAAFALNSGKAVASSDAVPLSYVSVQQGESLWQLAEHVAPNADPRDVIDDIVSLNHLGSSGVVAGQRLAIPAQYIASK